MVWINKGYPIKRIFSILKINRSTYYERENRKEKTESNVKRGRKIPGFSWDKNKKQISDEIIKDNIKEIKSTDYGKFYGYKKVAAALRKE